MIEIVVRLQERDADNSSKRVHVPVSVSVSVYIKAQANHGNLSDNGLVQISSGQGTSVAWVSKVPRLVIYGGLVSMAESIEVA